MDVRLEGATLADVPWNKHFRETAAGVVLPAESYPAHRLAFLDAAIEYLEAVSGREPVHGCFGLHEWAMLYRTEERRHSRVPLRVTAGEIVGLVEEQGLRCTHYDAFRFFADTAAPRNKHNLTRSNAVRHDQPGCIHANMDLYKFAYGLSPYIPSELVAEAFLLAVHAREIDMRASPYDLNGLGCEAIRVETVTGREQYVDEQRRVAKLAEPLRRTILDRYRKVRDARV